MGGRVFRQLLGSVHFTQHRSRKQKGRAGKREMKWIGVRYLGFSRSVVVKVPPSVRLHSSGEFSGKIGQRYGFARLRAILRVGGGPRRQKKEPQGRNSAWRVTCRLGNS